jgi:hypothetical protein
VGAELRPAGEDLSSGTCNLCGRRRTRIAWEMAVADRSREPSADDNPMVYGVCDPCSRTLREFADVVLGEGLRGLVEFSVPPR